MGAVIAQKLHSAGMNIAIHYSTSQEHAHTLRDALNQKRPNSVICVQADLLKTEQLDLLVKTTIDTWGRLDGLINNASTFYPTPLGSITEENWQDLIGTNLKGPLFLSQLAAPHLAKNFGCILNMIDIHAKQPLKNYPLYCAAKAGLAMLTTSLAKELGPNIRVNGIAPGAILWPEGDNDIALQKNIIQRTPLKRMGTPEDVAKTILFLIQDADFITGQILAVDGGRSLNF